MPGLDALETCIRPPAQHGPGPISRPRSFFGWRTFGDCGDANRSPQFATGYAAVAFNSYWSKLVADAGLFPRVAPNRDSRTPKPPLSKRSRKPEFTDAWKRLRSLVTFFVKLASSEIRHRNQAKNSLPLARIFVRFLGSTLHQRPTEILRGFPLRRRSGV